MEKTNIITQDAEPETTTVNEPINTEAKQPTNKKSFAVLSLFILLLIVIAAMLGGAYYFWQQQALLENKIKNLDADLSSQISQSDEKNKQELSRQIALQNQQVAELKNDLKTLQDLSQSALKISKRGQRGWILAEVDYLLRLANRRLQVARDIQGAIAALASASERLYDLGDLTLFPVRQQLSEDIAKLKSIKEADVNGVAMALDQMSNYIHELPFKSVQEEVKSQLDKKAETETQISVGDDFADSVITTIMNIGDIKIHQRSIAPASSAKQQQQYEVILRTHILAARLAALRNDEQQFIYEINKALDILKQYYQQDDNRIQQMQQDLTKFSSIKLLPELPTLSTSWLLLNKLINKTPVDSQELKK